MGKTMQQIDHDAWEEGYGHNYHTSDYNDIVLSSMYEALAHRNAEKKADKSEDEPMKEEE